MSHKLRQAQEWIRAAERAGWRVEMCSPNSHAYARLFPHDRQFGPISIAGTPLDRTRRNERAQLRRAGLNV